MWDISYNRIRKLKKKFLFWTFWCLEILVSLPTKKRLQTWWKSIHFDLNISSFLTDNKSFLTNLIHLFLLIISYLSSLCWDCQYVDVSRRSLLDKQYCTKFGITLFLIQFSRKLKSSNNCKRCYYSQHGLVNTCSKSNFAITCSYWICWSLVSAIQDDTKIDFYCILIPGMYEISIEFINDSNNQKSL